MTNAAPVAAATEPLHAEGLAASLTVRDLPANHCYVAEESKGIVSRRRVR